MNEHVINWVGSNLSINRKLFEFETWQNVLTSMDFMEVGWHAAWKRTGGSQWLLLNKIQWKRALWWFLGWVSAATRLWVNFLFTQKMSLTPLKQQALNYVEERLSISICNHWGRRPISEKGAKISIWSRILFLDLIWSIIFFLDSIWSSHVTLSNVVTLHHHMLPYGPITHCHMADLSCQLLTSSLKCHVILMTVLILNKVSNLMDQI